MSDTLMFNFTAVVAEHWLGSKLPPSCSFTIPLCNWGRK